MKRQLHIRWLTLSLCIVICLSLLAACTTTSTPATSDSAPAAEGETAAEVGSDLPADAAEEQVLRYVARNFSLLNPATEGGFGRAFTSHIWMPLFIRDYENNVNPWLATGWEVSDDGLVYTISIHPDATWSDGSPVTAADVKAYLEFAMSPACVGCRVSGHTALQLIEGEPKR